jgi:hypothetical protein
VAQLPRPLQLSGHFFGGIARSVIPSWYGLIGGGAFNKDNGRIFTLTNRPSGFTVAQL